MNKEHVTKGGAIISGGRFEVRATDGELMLTADHKLMRKSRQEREANIALAAEAFNVLHETGSTPRELETALADLVATAGEVEGMMDGDKDKQEAWAEELSRLYIALDAAKAVLSKQQPATYA